MATALVIFDKISKARHLFEGNKKHESDFASSNGNISDASREKH